MHNKFFCFNGEKCGKNNNNKEPRKKLKRLSNTRKKLLIVSDLCLCL